MIYVIGRNNCPWCDKTKELLDTNNQDYTYINMSDMNESNYTLFKGFITTFLGISTLPVVIDVIGGYTELEREYNGT